MSSWELCSKCSLMRFSHCLLFGRAKENCQILLADVLWHIQPLLAICLFSCCVDIAKLERSNLFCISGIWLNIFSARQVDMIDTIDFWYGKNAACQRDIARIFGLLSHVITLPGFEQLKIWRPLQDVTKFC